MRHLENLNAEELKAYHEYEAHIRSLEEKNSDEKTTDKVTQDGIRGVGENMVKHGFKVPVVKDTIDKAIVTPLNIKRIIFENAMMAINHFAQFWTNPIEY